MKRTLRWLLVAGCALILLGGLFVGVEHFRGERALKARTDELRARGEKLSVVDVEPPHPQLELNAWRSLLALTNEIIEVYSNFGVLPPTGRFAAPGRAVASSRVDAWASERKTN